MKKKFYILTSDYHVAENVKQKASEQLSRYKKEMMKK